MYPCMSNEEAASAPTYSVVIPVYNEQETIKACIDSLLASELSDSLLEIIVVDGMSEDRTQAIVGQYAEERENVRLLENPDRTTPTGFNVGFAASQNDVIVMISGHSHVSPDFFERLTETFTERAPDADVVGGRMVPVGKSYTERAIATALMTPVGSSSTRFESNEGYVETVNFGAYRDYVWEEVGEFDPDLPRAQDYEYNRRVREHGHRIYQNPEIEVYYTPRSSYRGLARQYYGNGLWKTRVYRTYGQYPLPPRLLLLVAVAGATGGLMLSLPLLGYLSLAAGIVYLGSLTYVSSKMLRQCDGSQWVLPGSILALVIMHVTFALGLIRGTAQPPTSS